ncbi:MAG: hypothetical protein JWP58_1011 [Hymenobacter sp.]|nr:hypothetical protein [Hymenobacter sp.]
MTKARVLEIVQQLPDNFELEDLFKRLLFLQQLEWRLEQAAKNDVVSFEEARKILGS